MSSDKDLPRTPEQVQEFMDKLAFDAAPGPEREKELLVSLPEPGEGVMVVRSIRLPLELHERVKKAAQDRGVATTALIREWIELGLSALENDQPISRADALRALASLQPLGGNHAA